MDVQRAREVLESSASINVTFEGESIWIDEINPDNNEATIHSLSSGKSMQVDLNRLHEPQ